MENVLETRNYDLFKFSDWNREIKERNLHKIDKCVKAEGWKKHPIIVNENYEVIDGQHRLVYAKAHLLPVYYVIIGGLTAQDCATMNNIRTEWSVEDYIKFYASQGNENYMRLSLLLTAYNFAPVSTILGMLKGNTNGGVAQSVRRGTFKITPKEISDVSMMYDFMTEIAPYVKAIRGRATCLFGAISFCYRLESINKDRLKKQIKNWISLITPPVNIEIAVEEIDKIYNRGIRQTEYVDIISEYKKYIREMKQRQLENLTGVRKQKEKMK